MSDLIVPGTASELNDDLKTLFKIAVAKGDAVGGALVAQQLRENTTPQDTNSGLIVPGASSGLEDGLKTLLKTALATGDAVGGALVTQELRHYEKPAAKACEMRW
jgi:uncharacterized protein YoaH (UPF0181 family)